MRKKTAEQGAKEKRTGKALCLFDTILEAQKKGRDTFVCPACGGTGIIEVPFTGHSGVAFCMKCDLYVVA